MSITSRAATWGTRRRSAPSLTDIEIPSYRFPRWLDESEFSPNQYFGQSWEASQAQILQPQSPSLQDRPIPGRFDEVQEFTTCVLSKKPFSSGDDFLQYDERIGINWGTTYAMPSLIETSVSSWPKPPEPYFTLPDPTSLAPFHAKEDLQIDIDALFEFRAAIILLRYIARWNETSSNPGDFETIWNSSASHSSIEQALLPPVATIYRIGEFLKGRYKEWGSLGIRPFRAKIGQLFDRDYVWVVTQTMVLWAMHNVVAYKVYPGFWGRILGHRPRDMVQFLPPSLRSLWLYESYAFDNGGRGG
ncbi:hypothetical protein BDZ45DRAFT_116729 [Acephala macrosclerotiorum]|nr:hypothetical protein BDZ45DRAFT_116729 [Acephala macrosclerotiorum]